MLARGRTWVERWCALSACLAARKGRRVCSVVHRRTTLGRLRLRGSRCPRTDEQTRRRERYPPCFIQPCFLGCSDACSCRDGGTRFTPEWRGVQPQPILRWQQPASELQRAASAWPSSLHPTTLFADMPICRFDGACGLSRTGCPVIRHARWPSNRRTSIA